MALSYAQLILTSEQNQNCSDPQAHLIQALAFSPPVFLFLSFFFIFDLLFSHGLESDRGVSPTNRDVGRRP